MGKWSNAEIDLEKRMRASGIFNDMNQENFKEKLELFLDNESPEQAVKDIEIIENIQRKAENKRLQLELEVYKKYTNDTRVLTAIDKFMNADMKDRDAALVEVLRVLNNARNKYDMIKIEKKIKERGKK